MIKIVVCGFIFFILFAMLCCVRVADKTDDQFEEYFNRKRELEKED